MMPDKILSEIAETLWPEEVEGSFDFGMPFPGDVERYKLDNPDCLGDSVKVKVELYQEVEAHDQGESSLAQQPADEGSAETG